MAKFGNARGIDGGITGVVTVLAKVVVTGADVAAVTVAVRTGAGALLAMGERDEDEVTTEVVAAASLFCVVSGEPTVSIKVEVGDSEGSCLSSTTEIINETFYLEVQASHCIIVQAR